MKNCLSCKYCSLYNATPELGEYTPAAPMAFQCDEGLWQFDEYGHTKRALDVMIKMAEKCDKYEPDNYFESIKICPICFKMIFADQKGVMHNYCSKKCKKAAGIK